MTHTPAAVVSQSREKARVTFNSRVIGVDGYLEAEDAAESESALGFAEEVVNEAEGEQFGELVEEARTEQMMEGHHAIPKQFGGAEDQELYDIEQSLHRDLHSDLKYEIDDEFFGESGYPGLNGSTDSWLEFFQANPNAQIRVFEVIKDLYTELDAAEGTSLLETFMENVANGNFLGF